MTAADGKNHQTQHYNPSPVCAFAGSRRGVNGHDDRGKAGSRADTESPSRSEVIGNPSDDGCSNRSAPKRDAYAQRHHSPAHGRFGRELHQAVGGIGEGQGRDTDDDERAGEEPVARCKSGQRAADPKNPRADRQQAEARLLAVRAQQCARHRANRHDRRQQTIGARIGVEDADRHRGNEDREVQAESPDQEQHDEDRLQVGTVPGIAKPLGEASFGARGPGIRTQFGDPQERERSSAPR